MIPECHYFLHKNSNRNNPGLQGLPLCEPDIPVLAVSRDNFIIGLDYLDVEHSPRYQRHDANAEKKISYNTFCNGYATDFCGLFKIYLPKVWWEKATIEIYEKTDVKEWLFIPGKTICDVSANGLYDWLNSPYSALFGWKKAKNLDELKAKAKEHALCVISAANKFRDTKKYPGFKGNKSGHISLYFYNLSPINPGGFDISQAGHYNYRLIDDDWWNAAKFQGNVGFFYHE